MKSYRKDRERCLENGLQFSCGCKVSQAQDTVINKADSSREHEREARKKSSKTKHPSCFQYPETPCCELLLPKAERIKGLTTLEENTARCKMIGKDVISGRFKIL